MTDISKNMKPKETLKTIFQSWWLGVCLKRGWKKRGRTNVKNK